MGLSKVKTKFALILNPDAELKASALNNFLESANKIKNFAIIGPAAESEENIENQTIKVFVGGPALVGLGP